MDCVASGWIPIEKSSAPPIERDARRALCSVSPAKWNLAFTVNPPSLALPDPVRLAALASLAGRFQRGGQALSYENTT